MTRAVCFPGLAEETMNVRQSAALLWRRILTVDPDAIFRAEAQRLLSANHGFPLTVFRRNSGRGLRGLDLRPISRISAGGCRLE